MEFWGVEVKAGENLLVELGEDRCIHLSQAALGEMTKKDKKANAPVFVTVGDQKLVIGTLSSDNFPQISYDLVFDKDFKLSHGWKDGSVYFTGYVAITNDDDDDDFDDSSEDEEVPALAPIPANAADGKNVKSAAAVKPNAEVPKAKAKPVEPADEEDSDDDSVEDEDDSEDEDSDEEMVGAEDDTSDEDDSSKAEDATPQKVQNGAKRPAPSNSKTPVLEKKAKLVTPTGKSGAQEGKKNVHTATPYPTKQTGKTPANNGKGKQQQSPQSGKSNKKFKSGGGGSQPNKGKRN